MKETTKNKIVYVNRQLLQIKLLERRLAKKLKDLSEWSAKSGAEISKYVQGLQNDSLHLFNAVYQDYVAKRMLEDELPYFYISNVTGLKQYQLYRIKVKIKKEKENA